MVGHHLNENLILSRPLHTHERPNQQKKSTKKTGRKLLQPSDKETKPEKNVNAAVQHLSNQQKNSVMESNGGMAPAPVVQVHKIFKKIIKHLALVFKLLIRFNFKTLHWLSISLTSKFKFIYFPMNEEYLFVLIIIDQVRPYHPNIKFVIRGFIKSQEIWNSKVSINKQK